MIFRDTLWRAFFSNFYSFVSDDPFQTYETSVSRGCRKPETLETEDDPVCVKMQVKEIWACRGNLCNAAINEPQPPPYDPIPMDAYKWLQARGDKKFKRNKIRFTQSGFK